MSSFLYGALSFFIRKKFNLYRMREFFPHCEIGRSSILTKMVSGKAAYYNHKRTIGVPVVRNEILEISAGFFHQPQSSGGG